MTALLQLCRCNALVLTCHSMVADFISMLPPCSVEGMCPSTTCHFAQSTQMMWPAIDHVTASAECKHCCDAQNARQAAEARPTRHLSDTVAYAPAGGSVQGCFAFQASNSGSHGYSTTRTRRSAGITVPATARRSSGGMAKQRFLRRHEGQRGGGDCTPQGLHCV